MFTIENEFLKVLIHPKGAELQRVFHKGHQLEYMWNGDPAFWAKHSPILFPIVGTLKGDLYYYDNKPYSLGRHGFARDREFTPAGQKPDAISFVLHSDEDTRKKYPFDFELQLSYQLLPQGLKIGYRVKNPSPGEDLWFSVGGHPAFKAPLVTGTAYEDYFLEFGKTETASRWPISKDGLIEKSPIPLLSDSNRLDLTRKLFEKDALVLRHPASTSISLRSDKTPHGLRVDFPDFPFLGIWAAKNADFVCIEPWCGIADSTDSDQQLVTKEGIQRLAPGGIFEREWTLTVF
ncbi:MAG TPA: aldose 1-epimerase family protein [Puia sp.]|nr:aldose 1-epimerase family protein [Puia sp.]